GRPAPRSPASGASLPLAERLGCGAPDGDVLALHRGDERLERSAVTDVGERLDCRAAHVGVGVLEQRLQLRDRLRIADLPEGLGGLLADVGARILGGVEEALWGRLQLQ